MSTKSSMRRNLGRSKEADRRARETPNSVPASLMDLTIRLNSVTDALRQADSVLFDTRERLEIAFKLLDNVTQPSLSERVDAEVRLRRLNERRAQAARTMASLGEMITSGQVQAAATVSPSSIVSGKEFKKDGEAADPSHIATTVAALHEGMAQAIVGRRVSEEVPTPSGGVFVLTGVYELNPTWTPPAEPADDDEPSGPVAADPDGALAQALDEVIRDEAETDPGAESAGTEV